MLEDESLDMLFSRSKLERTSENVSEAKSITAQLGYLPLALDQAGSYICDESLSLTLFASRYEKKKAEILEHIPLLTKYRKMLNKSDTETALNVFTTLELSKQFAETKRLEKPLRIFLL